MNRPGLVLIVDDERDLRALVDFNLRQAGYETLHAGSGSEALSIAASHRPQIVVLDLNLPDMPGTEVCRRLRADPRTRGIAIVMLTARGTETDRVVGFELGADDYVTKPFSVRELVLRVDAILRRLQGGEPEPVLQRGPIALDRQAFTCRVDGSEVALTVLEFRLLGYLLEAPGRVRTRDDLLTHVWNASTELETRTIDTHIKRLRDKLGAAGEAIETVRGIGYRLR
ncbi:MAG: response regulator transcription factor [Myxococcales bacterium]|nr:response regulator transcription factor [Myxococcales bacterium]